MTAVDEESVKVVSASARMTSRGSTVESSVAPMVARTMVFAWQMIPAVAIWDGRVKHATSSRVRVTALVLESAKRASACAHPVVRVLTARSSCAPKRAMVKENASVVSANVSLGSRDLTAEQRSVRTNVLGRDNAVTARRASAIWDSPVLIAVSGCV